jgi:hypothetical protein
MANYYYTLKIYVLNYESHNLYKVSSSQSAEYITFDSQIKKKNFADRQQVSIATYPITEAL